MILRVDSLSFRYGGVAALADVSFAVAPGASVGILGPNGSGKSTLFRILAGLLKPDGGHVELRAAPGIVFQSHTSDRLLTIDENLICQGALLGLPRRAVLARSAELLPRLGLSERRREPAGSLSGGQRRRLEIGMALLDTPPLLLLDEASAGLDPLARREFGDLLEELRQEWGTAVLFTTHLLDEADRAGHIVLLGRGRVVVQGSPEELKRRVGGTVLTLDSADAEALGRLLVARGQAALRRADRWLLSVQDAPAVLAGIAAAAPGLIRGASFHGPTLEDVYLRETGETFDE